MVIVIMTTTVPPPTTTILKVNAGNLPLKINIPMAKITSQICFETRKNNPLLVFQFNMLLDE
jgi:hypothetical protein